MAKTLSPLDTTHLRVSQDQMAQLMRMRGVVAGTCRYNSAALTARIRNAVIRNLERGLISGGGEAAAITELLGQHLHLEVGRTWGQLKVKPEALAADPALAAELLELCHADFTAAVMRADTKGHRWQTPEQLRTRFQNIYTTNQELLKSNYGPVHHTTGGTGLIFQDDTYLHLAATTVAKRRRPELQAKIVQVITALKSGLEIEFAYNAATNHKVQGKVITT